MSVRLRSFTVSIPCGSGLPIVRPPTKTHRETTVQDTSETEIPPRSDCCESHRVQLTLVLTAHFHQNHFLQSSQLELISRSDAGCRDGTWGYCSC